MRKLAILACFLLFLAIPAKAQVPVSLSPVAHMQFLDNNGKPLASGCVNTYQAGTVTPAVTYIDSFGITQNTNPIILDAGGFANIWLPNAAFKFKVVSFGGVNCASGVTQWTVDNISGILGLLNFNNTWTGTNTFTQPVTITPNVNQIVLGTGGNQTTANFPAPAGNITLNFPNTADTIIGRATTDNMTNKTITGTFISSAFPNPALTGGFRMPNLDFLTSRNFANNGDVPLIGLDTLGFIEIGNAISQPLINGLNLTFGGDANITSINPTLGNGGTIHIVGSNGGGAGAHTGGSLIFTPGTGINGGANGTINMVGGFYFFPPPFTFAFLAAPANGALVYCSDCTIANPCAGGGTGAMAKRLNGAWVCN
jgi:hypothetical protein